MTNLKQLFERQDKEFDEEFTYTGRCGEKKFSMIRVENFTKDSPIIRDDKVIEDLKSHITQSKLEVVKWMMRMLPEERIIHAYLGKQDDGRSTEYCNGWNDYRNKLIAQLQSELNEIEKPEHDKYNCEECQEVMNN